MEFTTLLTASVLGVTLQQICKKAYNKKVSGGTFTFTALSILFALTVFIAIAVFNGTFNFNSEILPYSIGFAVAYGSASIGSFLAISTGPMSITSLLVQYSLSVPTIYGLCTGDKASLFLYVGLGLLFISLFLVNIEKKGEEKKITLKWGVFAFLAFFGNGLCSTVQKAQQDVFVTEQNTDGYKSEFMIIALAVSFIAIAVSALIFERQDLGAKIKTGAHWYVICGLANGLVNLFVIMLAKYDASIVFPVISAGGIVATALVGIFIYKEKLSVMQIIGMVLGTSSIVFLNL